MTTTTMPVTGWLAPDVDATGATTEARCALCGVPAGSGPTQKVAEKWEVDIDTHGACGACLDAEDIR